MTDPTANFTKMVPGFEFLQNLVKGASSALPQVGQWIAPTLDPEELDKRIQELKTVQFWLEQNARMLAASIQALEVQRMTLSTLKSMNVSLGDLTESLKIRVPEPAAPAPTRPAPPAPAAPAPAAPSSRCEADASDAPPAAPAGVVDPMQWWGALTQQFTEIATKAVRESSANAAHNLAGSMVQQGVDAAGQLLKTAADMPQAVARAAAGGKAGAQPSAAAAAKKAAKKAAGTGASTGASTAGKKATAKRPAARRP